MPPRPASLVLAVALAACASARGSRMASANAAALAATAAEDSVAAAAGRPPNPVTGTYNCILTAWSGNARGSFRYQSQGYLTLAADSSYRFSTSPMVGRYSLTPARAVRWAGGYFADKGPPSATIPASGARRVEIVWPGRDGDTRWVCGVTSAPPG